MADKFIHPQALCESNLIGEGTRIWAFVHVLPGARIGCTCNVCDGVFIESDVIVGDRVTIKSGVQLWDGVRLQDDVFVGPNVSFSNDRFPRSRHRPARFLQTIVEQGASIGAGAVLLPGITIGAGAMVGAGAVVTRSVPANAIVIGNPARITGYTHTKIVDSPLSGTQTVQAAELGVAGARLCTIPQFADLRGRLTALEFGGSLPFSPQRCFLIYDVPSREVRGEHAHRRCEQLLVSVRGSVSAVVDDGRHRADIRLDSPQSGLYIPAMVWSTQYRYSEDAVLMVLASHPYDSEDYIRNYSDFLALTS